MDYQNLNADSWTTIDFTLRNSGTTALNEASVKLAGNADYAADLSQSLLPGDSTVVSVPYKTGTTLTNPTYQIDADAKSIASGTVHLDYHDLGISEMKVVSESQGKRTIQITLYNDSDAKLANSGREVTLTFTQGKTNAPITLVGSPAGVEASGNVLTIKGDALARIDQGSLTLTVEYDLHSYVTTDLGQQEIPESGVYLYAQADVVSNGKVMAEYAVGNNAGAVHLTGALARTGEETTLDILNVYQEYGVTCADIQLHNNSLQQIEMAGSNLTAILLDENGNPIETITSPLQAPIDGEGVYFSTLIFDKIGSSVVVLFSKGGTGLQMLRFSGIGVELDDFQPDPSDPNRYVCSVSTALPASTLVSFISSQPVTVNGTDGGTSGAVKVDITGATKSITVRSGDQEYVLNLSDDNTGTGGGTSGGTSSGTSGSSGSSSSAAYQITVERSQNGQITADRRTAARGQTVTLTAAPETGYRLGKLTVTDKNDTAVPLSDLGGGKYRFTMPGAAVTVSAAFSPLSADLPFIDVSSDAYYHDAVKWAVSNGITNGTSDTLFSPDASCTRAQMVTLLWRAAGSPAPRSTTNPFRDVPQNAYYHQAVLWAVEQGITNGTGPDTFSPDASCTRAQTVTFLWRAAGSPEPHGTAAPFRDVSAEAYYRKAVQWAVEQSITNGTSVNAFSPDAACTRAQIVTFLYRAQGK